MPSLPTNFNDTDALIDYAKDTGIAVGVGFIVPAIVLSAVLIFIFVKFCGGEGKTRQEFNARPRLVLIVIAAVVFVICVATCIVAWTYNDRIHKGITNGSDTLQGVIFTSNTLMFNVNSTVGDLKNDLLYEINAQTDPVIQNITNLLVPLNGILGVVQNAEGSLTNLTVLTEQIVENITSVEESLSRLQEFEAIGIISDVPNPADVPSVDSEYVRSLNSSVNNLHEVVENVKNMTNNVNDTLTEVSDHVTANLLDLTDDYNQKADEVLSYIVDFQVKISDTNDTFNDVSGDVKHYSSIRRSIVAAILVLPLTLTGIALAGVVFKIKILLKISAAFCFIFMFWYFLVAGINFIAYYTLDQACTNQDEIVGNALSIAGGTINIPSANLTIVVSDKVTRLLKCSGNDTLINIFEFNFLIDDLTGEIESEVESLITQTNDLNQTAEYQTGLDSLAQMENSSVNLDFLQNASLPTVHSQLANISSEVNETIYGPEVGDSITSVNDFTNNLMLSNGTTISEYYDETNITSLNCTTDPYDQLSPADQQELCTRAAKAIGLTHLRNLSLIYADDVNSNVTNMQDKLYGFEAALPTIYDYQNDTKEYSNEIRGFLDEAFYSATAIIVQVQNAAQVILALIYTGSGDLVNDTQCAFLGVAYAELSKNLCEDISDSLAVITAMMIIGAVMLFASAIVSMLTSYKIERDFVKKL